jgi:hypothetical protein
VRAAWLVVLGACGRFGFGASGDAAHGDAATDADASTDASTDAPAVTDCAGTLVCDPFDTIGPAWTVDTQSGTVTVDTTRAYRGTSSVHLHIDQVTTSTTNPRALLDTSPAALPITGTIYTRAWMYFATPMPTSPFAQLINFANLAGQGLSMGERNGAVTNNDYTTGGYMESATVALPLGRWTCLQFEAPSGTTSTIRIFVDGAEVTDVALAISMAQPAPDHAYLGIEWVGTVTSQPAYDAWMDEVIISASPTTCAQ